MEEGIALKERKFKEDWHLEAQITDRGKEIRTAVYSGDYYILEMTASEKSRKVLLSALCFGFSFLALFAMMQLNLPATRCIYVLPIALCGLFPLLYWFLGLYSFARSAARMTSVEKEKGIARIVRSSLGWVIVAGLSCIGNIIFAIVNKLPKEWPDIALFALSMALGLLSFLTMRKAEKSIRTEVRVQPEEDE